MRLRRHRAALWLIALLGAGMARAAAIVEVAQLPDATALLAVAGSLPQERGTQLRALLEMHGRGADECVLRRVSALDARQPALAAGLREMLAGVYLRERRLFRATQQLEAIPAKRRTDQANYLASHIALRQRRLEAAREILAGLARRRPRDVLVARDEAQLASLRGDSAGAAEAAGRWLAARPGDERALFVLARARMLQGRPGEARRVLEDLLARNPRHAAASLNLGLVQLAEGDVVSARASFVRGREAGRGDATPYAAEAAAALLAGEPAAARSAAAGAVRQNAADPLGALLDILATGSAGDGRVARGSRSAAGAWFTDLERVPLPSVLAAEIEDPVAAGRIAVASLLLQSWSARAALEWLRSTAPAATGGPLLEFTTLRALLADGQLEAARQKAARLEAAATGLAGPAVFAAEVAVRLNDRSGAIAAMQRALQAAPGQARLWSLSGDLRNALDRPAQAIPDYRRALRLAPSDPQLLNQLAATMARVGDRRGYAEALQLVAAGLAQRPHYLVRARLLDTRADLLDRLGRADEALEAYRELSTTVGGMNAPEPWTRLGELELAAGDQARAGRAFEEALDFGREFPRRAFAAGQLRKLGARHPCE